jgi:DNA-binding PadR family transcriptional regulator
MSQRRSSTEFAILGLLTVEPMSGYDLRKHFQESLIYFWNESYGQIYPTLKQLAKEGLVAPAKAKQASKRDRQVYSLTSKGRARLQEWLAQPPQLQPIRNEFLLKLFLGSSAPRGALGQHIRRFRTEQEELLAMFLIIRDSVRVEHAKSPNLTFWMLGLSHGIRIRRAEIEWCNDALRVLEPASERQNASSGAHKSD